MRYAVLRPFNSPSRRFSVGQVVTADEIDGPVSAEDWVNSGVIREEKPDAPVEPLKMRRAGAVTVPPVNLENDDALV